MKINTIRIHNFRSIVDVSLSLHDYTLIVGANNAGKSNLVSAVRCFYDGLKFEADRDSPKVNCGTDRDAESYVQIDFVDVNVKVELGVWTGKSQKGVFRIRRYLSSSNEKWTNCYCLVNVDGTVSDKVKPQRKLPEGFGTLTYIPSMSKPSEDIRTTGPSALRDLVGDIFNETLERNKKYLKLKKAIEDFSGEIRACKNKSGMSVDSMELQINERMKKWDASFKLGLKPLSPQEILKGLVTVGITDSFAGEGLELEQYGSGFQRSLICEIINVKAGLTTRLKRSDSMRLLIFEEPEAFLHSDQQSELARSLMKIAEDGTQVVCTSHAQTFVSRKMADVTGIVRLVKDAGVTNAYQMDEKQWNELKRPVSPYPDKLQTYITRTTLELDEYRYRCWLDGSRADAFFASHVLLVEGATESALISRLVDERKLNLPHGTVVVDCLGKYNYFRFIRLMYAYGIKIVVVIDSDSGKKGEELEKHNAWNSFVKEEVARSGDRAAFWAIPEDLERYLSIKSVAAKGDDLKPYNMLNEYEAGRYDKDKLRSFCTKLEELFAK